MDGSAGAKQFAKICVVLLSLASIINIAWSIGPSVTNIEYVEKQVELFDLSLSLAVLSAQFDQDVYYEFECPGLASNTTENQTSFLPCCSDSITENCLALTKPDRLCLDGTFTSTQDRIYANRTVIEFQVANPESCHSVVLGLNVLYGDVWIAVSVNPENQSPSDSTQYDFLNIYTGNTGWFACCSEIRAINPTWDGRVWIKTIPIADSFYDVALYPSTLVNATEFYWSQRIEIDCGDYGFDACYLDTHTGGCFFVPPTSDPLSDLLQTIGGTIPTGSFSLKQISIGLMTKRVAFTSETQSSTYFPIDSRVWSDPNCIWKFPQVVNSDREPMVPFQGTPTRQTLSCSVAGYQNTIAGFKSTLDIISNARPDWYAQITQYFLRAMAYVTNNDWAACRDMIQNDLLETTPASLVFENTISCYYNDSLNQPTFFTDPCCNLRLQASECCEPRTVNIDGTVLSVSSNSVANQCTYPRCTEQTLGDYIILRAATQDRATGCTARSTKGLGETFLTVSALSACFQTYLQTPCVTNAQCRSTLGRDDTYCLAEGYCSIACESDADCPSGTCASFTVSGNRNISSCVLINPLDVKNIDFTRAAPTFVRCVQDVSNPFILLYIKVLLGLNADATNADISEAFLDQMTSPTCLGEHLLFDDVAAMNNEVSCNTAETCNWAPCNSLTDANCTQANCLDPAIGSTHFCGACLYDQCIEASNFVACQLNQPITPELCAEYGASYNPLNTLGDARCIFTLATTQATCLMPDYCADETALNCSAKCHVPALDQVTCTGTWNGRTVEWQSWTRNSVNYGLCVVASTDYNDCLGIAAGTQYWPGSTWTDVASSPVNYESFCGLVGICNPDLSNIKNITVDQLMSRDACQAESKCFGCETCTTEAACLLVGDCDDHADLGCVAPYIESEGFPTPCPRDTQWTPVGCLIREILLQADCTAPNQWIAHATTKEECEAKGQMCLQPVSQTATAFVPQNTGALPGGWSWKNATQCAACGGVRKSYYTWTPAEWVPNTWYQFQWRERTFSAVNRWVNTPDVGQFTDLVIRAIARRYSDIIEAELLCKYGQLQDTIGSIVASCAPDRDANVSVNANSIFTSVVGVPQVCTLIYSRAEQTGLGYLESADNTLVKDGDCTDIRMAVVPLSQFEQRGALTLGGVSLSATQSAQNTQVKFIKVNGVVVGEVIGDGLSFESTQTIERGVRVCIYIPSTFETSVPVGTFGVAQPNGDFTEFIPILESLAADTTEYCVELSSNATLFPIALQTDWQNASFITTFFAYEIFLIYFGVLAYAVVLCFALYQFAIHIKFHDSEKKFWNLSKIALLILLIFLINRILYLILFSTGQLETVRTIDVIFSELPALLFFNIYCIIVLRWAEIHHFTMESGKSGTLAKLKPVMIAINSLIIAAFIVLVILFFTLPQEIVILNCASPDTQEFDKTSTEIVSIVYKVFFAAFSLALCVLFLVYGTRVLSMVRKSLKMAAKRNAGNSGQKRQALYKLGIVSIVCTVCLLAQAGNLLHASFDNSGRTLIGVLIFVYCVEIPAAVIFVIMFQKASLFSKVNRPAASGMTGTTNRDTLTGNSASVNSANSATELDRNSSVA